MESNIFATTVIKVLVCFEIGVAEILTKPSVTEVVVGRSTFLNCSANSTEEIHWFHTPFGSNQERNPVYGDQQLYSPYKGRFQMEKNEANGDYNLVIPVVRTRDAGVYECQDESGQGKKASAQLIVLDTNPVCEPHLVTHEIIRRNTCGIEPTQVILSCSVDFKGNEAPVMKWRNFSDNTSISEGVTHATIGNQRVVYYLTISENSTVRDGESFVCSTTRSAASTVGCKSGQIKTKGTASSTCVASDICKPYKSYSAAIICTILIVLPIAIGGTIFVLWYLRVYRPKKRGQKGVSEEEAPHSRSIVSSHNSNKNSMKETKQLLCAPNDLTSKIQELEIELERERSEAKEREGQLRKQSDEMIEKLKKKNEASERKVIHLEAKVKDLERSLYPSVNIDYAEKLNWVHTIKTDAGKQQREPINGMTILGSELFVSHENNSLIEVYECETFQYIRNLTIVGMSHPMDIASCKVANCLYIIFREDSESESHIMKLDPKGKLIKKWSTGGERGRLSTYESNVIVCLFEQQVIKEFSGDGKLILTVPLSPAVGFNHPRHAIKVTSSHFVVCHGDTKDELHRVCIIDVQERIVKDSRDWESKQKDGKLNVPICLAADSERSILVADRDNQKIRLLNCHLRLQRNLIIKHEMGLDGYPVRICLDETKKLLYVATTTLSKKEVKEGRIIIFSII